MSSAILSNIEIMGGTPCLTGTRVPFQTLLDYLEGGDSIEDFLEDFPMYHARNRAFLEGYAVGTQNYICLPSGSVFAWTFFGPQATLFNDDDKQIITHFSPNLGPIAPEVADTPRATWQHSKDTSTVWAKALAMATSASDPTFVQAGAIPWLLLEVVGDQDGPTGGHKLRATTFIQRLNTSGGVAPSTGCTLSTDVGKKALVPYTTDYLSYKAAESDADDGN